MMAVKYQYCLLRNILSTKLFEKVSVAQPPRGGCYLQPALANSMYRTNDGTEVDLLRETSDGLQPIEIKSSTTWSASLSDELRKFLTLMPSSIRPTIVYGGKSYPSTIGNVSATNFLDFV